MNAKQIPFAAAVELSKNGEADFSPYAALSDIGRAKVISFADQFYAGEGYDAEAVLTEFEQNAESLLAGYSHVVELRRVNKSMFGGFVVDTLSMEAVDFDWFIQE